MCDFIIVFCWKELSILAPFPRNSTSKLQLIDLWPFMMTWGQIKYSFLKSHMWLYIRLVLIQTLYLAPLARYSTSQVVVNDLGPSGSPKVKYFNFFQKLMCDFIIVFCWKELSIWHHFRKIPHPSSRSLTFDLWRWSEVKYFIIFGNPICDFISDLYWYELSISHRLRDIPHHRFWFMTFDLWRSLKIKYLFLFAQAHVWLYIIHMLIQTLYLAPLSRYFISQISINNPWPPLGHRRSKLSMPVDRPYVTPYSSSIDSNSLSRLVSVIFACQISLDHGQTQTFDLLKVKVIE